MPVDDFEQFITRHRIGELSDNQQLNSLIDPNEFWNPDALTTLVFNSSAGGSAIFEYHGEHLEALRMNDRFFDIINTTRDAYQKYQLNVFERVLPEDKAIMIHMLENTDVIGNEGECEFRTYDTQDASKHFWIRLRVRLIAANNTTRIYNAAIENITEQKRLQQENELNMYSQVLFNFFDEVFVLNTSTNTSMILSSKKQPDIQKFRQFSLPYAIDFWVKKMSASDEERFRTFISSFIRQSESTSDDRESKIRYRLKIRESSFRWLETTMIRIADKSCLCGSKDITEQVEAEEEAAKNKILAAQQAEQERYRIIVEQTGAAVFEWNHETGSFYQSPSFSRYEMSRQSELGTYQNQVWPQIVLSEDMPIVQHFLDEIKSGKNQITTKLRFKLTDGSYRWSRLTCFLVNNTEGKILRTIGTIIDIDDEVKAEERQRIQNECNRVIMEGMHAVTFIYTIPGDELDYTVYASGEEPREVHIPDCRNNLPQSSLLDANCITGFLNILQKARKKEINGTFECNTRLFVRDFSPCRLHYSSVADSAGKMVRIVGRLDDIRREKKLEERYNNEAGMRRALSADVIKFYQLNLTRNLVGRTEKELPIHEPDYESIVGEFPSRREWQHWKDIFSLENQLKEYQNGNTLIEDTYRRMIPGKGMGWVHTSGRILLEPQSGDIISFIYVRDVDDEVTTRKIVECTIQNEYDYLLSIDLNLNQARRLNKKGNDPKQWPLASENYEKDTAELIRNTVSETDVPALLQACTLENIRKNIEETDVYRINYTLKDEFGGGRKQMSFSSLDSSNNMVLCTRIDITDTWLEEQYQESMKEQDQRLLSWIDTIPGGAGTYALSPDGMKTLYVSDKMGLLEGYSEKEYAETTAKDELAYLHPDDLEKMKNLLAVMYEEEKGFDFTYRVMAKTGQYHWLRIYTSPVRRDGDRLIFNAIFMDMENQKQNEIRQTWKNELFRTLVMGLDLVTFDYDPATDVMSYSMQGDSLSFSEYLSEGLGQSRMIFPDDIARYKQHLNEAVQKSVRSILEFRGKFFSYEFTWCRATFMSVLDHEERIIHVVGWIKDIRKEVSLSERVAELRKKAETDLLTGLLNHSASEEFIRQLLSDSDAKDHGALLILDVDNFKQVNDQLGHQTGDSFLSEVGKTLLGLFRENDIIGRCGGDEFVVYMNHIEGVAAIERKAQQLMDAVSAIPVPQIESVCCSIGIAFSNAGSRDYANLFKQADTALYQAKSAGKNCFKIYSDNP